MLNRKDDRKTADERRTRNASASRTLSSSSPKFHKSCSITKINNNNKDTGTDVNVEKKQISAYHKECTTESKYTHDPTKPKEQDPIEHDRDVHSIRKLIDLRFDDVIGKLKKIKCEVNEEIDELRCFVERELANVKQEILRHNTMQQTKHAVMLKSCPNSIDIQQQLCHVDQMTAGKRVESSRHKWASVACAPTIVIDELVPVEALSNPSFDIVYVKNMDQILILDRDNTAIVVCDSHFAFIKTVFLQSISESIQFVVAMCCDPDTNDLYVLDKSKGIVFCVDNGFALRSEVDACIAEPTGFTIDRRHMYVFSERTSELSMIDIDKCVLLKRLDLPFDLPPKSIRSVCDQYVYMSTSNKIFAFDKKTLSMAKTLTFDNQVACFAYMPNAKLFCVVEKSGSVSKCNCKFGLYDCNGIQLDVKRQEFGDNESVCDLAWIGTDRIVFTMGNTKPFAYSVRFEAH